MSVQEEEEELNWLVLSVQSCEVTRVQLILAWWKCLCAQSSAVWTQSSLDKLSLPTASKRKLPKVSSSFHVTLWFKAVMFGSLGPYVGRWHIGSWAVPGTPWLGRCQCLFGLLSVCASLGVTSVHLQKPYPDRKWWLVRFVPETQTYPLCWHLTCWTSDGILFKISVFSGFLI